MRTLIIIMIIGFVLGASAVVAAQPTDFAVYKSVRSDAENLISEVTIHKIKEIEAARRLQSLVIRLHRLSEASGQSSIKALERGDYETAGRYDLVGALCETYSNALSAAELY